MTSLTCTPLNEAAVMRLVERGLRREDERECWASGHSPMAALTTALDGIGPKYAAWALVDGYPTPVGAFGINVDRVGAAAWSLWTDDLDRPMKRQILKDTRKWVLRLLDEANVPTAANFVAVSNRLALRWLAASDCFEVSTKSIPIGPSKVPMYPFRTKSPRALRFSRHV